MAMPTELEDVMDAPVEGAPADGMPAEAEVEAAPAEAEVIAEAPVLPAEPPPPAEDQGAVIADLQAQVASLMSERDIAQGQAATAQALVEPMRVELAELRVKLADYELGAALTAVGLPAQAGRLVKQLYSVAMSGCSRPVSIGDWLASAINDPSSPVSSLTLMRPVVAPGSDPRNGASPVNGVGSPQPGLARFPSFGR